MTRIHARRVGDTVLLQYAERRGADLRDQPRSIKRRGADLTDHARSIKR